MGEAIVLAFEAGFEVFYFVGEFAGLAFDALEPILLFEERFEAFAAADELIVDAEAFGFVAELVALAALDIALAFVLFDAFCEVVERFERTFVEWAEIYEAFELVVDFAALDPEGFDADRDFEAARAGGDAFGFGLFGVDFFGELAEFHRGLGPAATFGDEFLEFALECFAVGDERADFGFFFAVVEQAKARAFEHVDHIVERDAVQARGEAVHPLGGGGVAERAELLHFAEADGEDVEVGCFVDVFETFAQQAIALLFAVAGDDRDFADVGWAAIGVAADGEWAVVGIDLEPAAGAAAGDGRQIFFAARGGHAVQDRAHELHERRFAGFVRAVEDGELGRQAAKGEVVPHAEAVDFEVGDFHGRESRVESREPERIAEES